VRRLAQTGALSEPTPALVPLLTRNAAALPSEQGN